VVLLLHVILLFLLVILLFLWYFPCLLDSYFLAFIVVIDEREVGEKLCRILCGIRSRAHEKSRAIMVWALKWGCRRRSETNFPDLKLSVSVKP
jgi:hypothetical protein